MSWPVIEVTATFVEIAALSVWIGWDLRDLIRGWRR